VLNHLVAVAPDGSTAVTGAFSNDYLTVMYGEDGEELWRARFDGGTGSFDYPTALAIDADGRVTVTGCSYTEEFSRESWDLGTVQYAPDGSELWRRVYDGPESQSDLASAVAVGDRGEVVVAGTSYASGSGSDSLVVKYEPGGVFAWSARFQGPAESFDAASAAALDAGGNVYAAATADFDLVTLAYDSAGRELWARTYASPAGGLDLARDLVLDGVGSVYVLADAAGDFATVKYRTDGRAIWARTRDGAGRDDVPFALALDGRGGVVVAGSSKSPVSKSDYLTVCYSPDGAELWAARYDGLGEGEDCVRGLAVDRDGNVFVSGESRREGPGGDFATVKYDPSGNLLWEVSYDGGAGRADVPFGLALDAFGGPRVFGRSGVEGGFDWVTAAYDADGRERWVRRDYAGDRAFDSAQAVALDDAGNVFVAGTAEVDNIVAIQYSPDGVELWEVRYDGPGRGNDDAIAAGLDPEQNLLVVGTSTSASGDADVVVLKFDGNGNLLWEARVAFGDGTHEIASGLAIDASGSTCVVGWTCASESDPDSCDALTAKVDSSGRVLWTRRYDSEDRRIDLARAVAVDGEGSTYVAGLSRRRTADSGFNDDILVVKYSAEGRELWARSYDGPAHGYDEAYAVAAAGGRVYVTGTSFRAGSGSDVTTLAYSEDGNSLWVAHFDAAAGIDTGAGLVVDASGQVTVAGVSFRRESAFDLISIAYDGVDGSERWNTRYDGPAHGGESGPVLALGPSGEVAVACSSFAEDVSEDFATVLLSPLGEVEWTARWRGDGLAPAHERPNAIAVDGSSNVLVAGVADGDLVVLKYASNPGPARFLRGDCNGDGFLRGFIDEAVFLLNFNFLGRAQPPCLAACDVNGDGAVEGQVTDALYLLNYAFLGGSAPVGPFPDCGPAALVGDASLGCGRPPPGCR
jgi:hypothetical protein